MWNQLRRRGSTGGHLRIEGCHSKKNTKPNQHEQHAVIAAE